MAAILSGRMSWTKMWLLTAIQKAQPSTDAATGMPSHRKPIGVRTLGPAAEDSL
jgi:hypothetical protein